MTDKRNWLPSRQVQLPLPLPPAPGIKRPIMADQCNRCHGVHLTQADRITCLQANAQREQF